MKTEIKDFKRMDLFKYYNERTNPFAFVTTKVEITNIYNYCKKNKNYYATIGYCVAKAMNQVEEFKYRYEDNKIYKYDLISPSFTQMFDDETIGFFGIKMTDNYHEFINLFQETQTNFKKNHQSAPFEDEGAIWLSCEPWFNATGLIPPFSKEITIPQVIWDRFNILDGKCYINLMIMVHHGFADGFHIGKFINTFQDLVQKIDLDQEK